MIIVMMIIVLVCAASPPKSGKVAISIIEESVRMIIFKGIVYAALFIPTHEECAISEREVPDPLLLWPPPKAPVEGSKFPGFGSHFPRLEPSKSDRVFLQACLSAARFCPGLRATPITRLLCAFTLQSHVYDGHG